MRARVRRRLYQAQLEERPQRRRLDAFYDGLYALEITTILGHIREVAIGAAPSFASLLYVMLATSNAVPEAALLNPLLTARVATGAQHPMLRKSRRLRCE